MEEQEIPSEDETLLLAVQNALEQGDDAAIQTATADLMAHIAKQPRSPDVLLKLQAHQHEALGQWEQAEALYRQALDMHQAAQDEAGIFKDYDDLNRLYTFLRQPDRALEAAQDALPPARRCEIRPVLGMALESLARAYLATKQPEEALPYASEMLELFPPDEPILKIQRLRALIVQARCFLALGQLLEVQASLDEAQPLIKPHMGSAIAGWWSVTAELKEREGDFEGAVEAWRIAIDKLRQWSQTAMLENPYRDAPLATILRHLGKALLAVEDVTGAEEAFQESSTIDIALHRPPR